MTTAVQSARLSELEETIGRGLETFVEVGEALREIRDSGLYREGGHQTFEAYCDRRWSMSRPRAYELMQSSEIVSAIADNGLEPPTNEAQARPLAPLKHDEEKVVQVWRGLREEHGDNITAKLVKESVEFALGDGQSTASGPARSRSATERMAVHFSSATDEWATPQDLFDELDAEFKFELDVCALDSSAKCPTYFTPETDGLSQDWGTFRCWMNPPYGDVIGDWMRKASEEAAKGAVVVCLVKAATETAWWWDYCLSGEIRFIKGRLRFGDATASAPFPSAVVVLGPGYLPRVRWWER